MTFVPSNAAICAGPGPHYSLGGGWSEFGPGAPTAPGSKPCPTCDGKGWYVRVAPRAEALVLSEHEDLLSVNARLRASAFGDAPEWEKANATLKHRVRELEAEVAHLREAFWAWESVAHSAESDPEEREDAAELWRALVAVMRGGS